MEPLRFFLLLLLAGPLPLPSPASAEGMFIVLDPGHGGSDQGGYDGRGFLLGHERVPEDAYTYDVAKRFERIAQAEGWSTWFTVVDREHNTIIDADADTILPAKNKLSYNKPHTGVRAYNGEEGLSKRLDTVYFGYARRGKLPAAFISVHFDLAPSDISGARIFTGEHLGSHQFVKILARNFRESGLGLRVRGEERACIVSRNRLYMLKYNSIVPRVLIELGNYNSTRDRKLMLSPQGREMYAQIIARAMKEYLREKSVG